MKDLLNKELDKTLSIIEEKKQRTSTISLPAGARAVDG